MAVTVVDSSNLEQVMADAGVELAEAPKTPEPKADKEPAAEAKEGEQKDEAKGEVKDDADGKTAEPDDDADDVEGDDGLTQRQKRELSAKMLKAIGKKHRQIKEAEEFAAHQYREKVAAELRTAELERRLKNDTQAKPEPEKVEPKRENFATETEYIDAKIKWGVDQGIQQREQQRHEAEAQARMQQQITRASEVVPDFDQVTSTPLNWPMPVAQYMRGSDMFAELGYHFGKNPAELERLGKLDPHKQLVALGKIEATLQPFGSKGQPSPKAADKAEPDGKASKAAPSTPDTGFSPSKARSDAPVIKPLHAGEGRQVEPDPRDMDVREMITAFQKQKGVNLHSRKRH